MNFHPAIVHFPIAFFISAAIFAFLSLFIKKELFREITFWLLLLGVGTAIGGVITGLIEEQNMIHNKEIHAILQKHKFNGLALFVVFISLLSWLWLRKNKFGNKEYMLWVVFIWLGSLMTIYQGFLGGEMVFQYGAGVKPMEPILEMEDNGHNHDSKSDSNTPDHHADSISHEMVSPETHPHETKPSSQTNVKIDTTQKKKKRKELKDMRY